jgi:hypothetical protein
MSCTVGLFLGQEEQEEQEDEVSKRGKRPKESSTIKQLHLSK